MKTLITATLLVHSPAFPDKEDIPEKYTCDGENVNPPISIEGIPEEARSLALIMDDPDAPSGTFTHWVMWNIPVGAEIQEDSAPGTQGVNDFGENHYGGPCPPSGKHRYCFKVYALDTMLYLDKSANKENLEQAMEDHVLAYEELVGYYGRK